MRYITGGLQRALRDTVDLTGIRTIRVDQRRVLNLEEYKLREAVESDFGELIREPFLLYEGPRLLVAYFHLGDNRETKPMLDAIWRNLPGIDFPEHYRSDGLPHTSQTIGYLPRVTTRRDYCTATKTAMEYPEAHKAIVAAAPWIGTYYRSINPRLFFRHRMLATKVLSSFQIEGGPFTSGIINFNSQLRYHFDSGNFKDVWSAMLGFKRDMGGGYLSMPEFGIAAEVCDRSLLMFDGQGILHGVTSLRPLKADAKRYTIVYYSMEQMWNCLPIGMELERIRHRRTVREYKRAGLAPGSAALP
jgi:hypothetical protein